MAEVRTTFCRICEASCGLEAEVDGGRLVALRPDPAHVVSEGYVCVKGVRYAEVQGSPDRLRHPERRLGDRFERVSWDDAYREIGRALRRIRAEHGPDSVAVYIGNPVAFSTTAPIFLQGLVKGLGTHNVFSAGSQDCNNKFAVTHRMYGSPAIQPIPDLDRTEHLIVIGSNPAVSHMSFVNVPRPVERLRAIERRGGRVTILDPRRTETAKVVGEHVFIRPDTDVLFLASFVRELFVRGAVDRARVARHMKHLAELERVVEPWTPERTAPATGVEPDVLRAIAERFVAASRGGGASIYASTGLNQGSNGTLAYWLVNAANAITGNLDRRGGALVGRGIVDLPKFGKKAGIGESRARSRVGGYPAVMDSFPASIFPDEVFTPGRGQIRAMIVVAGNPLLSCPDEARMRAALGELELLVSIDLFRNETGSLAHYVLPTLSWLERSDLPIGMHGMQPVPYLQLGEAVVAPDGEQRAEWSILADLANAAGVPLFGSKAFDRFFAAARRASRLPLVGGWLGRTEERMLDALLRASGIVSLETLAAHPHGMLLPPTGGDSFLGKRVLTDDGKVDLAPRDLADAAPARLEEALATALRDRGRLKVFSKRELRSHNSWLHNAPSLLGNRSTNYAYVHPDDAARAGVADGDLARIQSATGEIELPIKITDDVMPGTIALPHGWGHGSACGLRTAQRAAGANANRLAASGPHAAEPFAGMTRLNGIPVELTPAGQRGGDASA